MQNGLTRELPYGCYLVSAGLPDVYRTGNYGDIYKNHYPPCHTDTAVQHVQLKWRGESRSLIHGEYINM